MKERQRSVLVNGLVAGVIGYAVVAAFFACLNLVQGRSPFLTPAMLGGWLFYDLEPVAGTVVAPGPVLAFNGVHLTGFLALGLLASAVAALTERRPALLFPLIVLASGLLFVSFALGQALGTATGGALSGWNVGLANALAFGVMAAYLAAVYPRLRAGLGLYPAGDPERPAGVQSRNRSLSSVAIDALVWSAGWPEVPGTEQEQAGGDRGRERETRLLYCPGLGGEVRLMRERRREGHNNVWRRSELVCMDFGDSCTDGTCPLFGLPTAVMRTRFEQSTLRL